MEAGEGLITEAAEATITKVAEAITKKVACNVRELREIACMSMEEAAERGRMDVNTWREIEAARFDGTIKTLAKVCVALNVDVREVFAPLPGEEWEEECSQRLG